jgi:hypothetical protein
MATIDWVEFDYKPHSRHIVVPDDGCGHWTGRVETCSWLIEITITTSDEDEYVKLTSQLVDGSWVDGILFYLDYAKVLTFVQYNNMVDAIEQAKSALHHLKNQRTIKWN